MRDNELIIRIVADLKDIKKRLPELGKSLKKTSDKGKKGFKAMDGAVAGFAKRIGATLISIYALKKGWDFTTKAAMAQEKIFRKLQTSVEITGVKYSDVKKEIDATFASLQSMTEYGDTDSAQALTTLLQLTSNYEKSMEGLPMVLDLAATGLFDINTAARYVAMAFEGNVEMLGRYIPELKASNNEIIKTGTVAEKTAEFMRIFNEKFTGTAQKNLDSSANKIQRLKNYLSDMGEAAGDKAAKGIGDLADNFTEFLMKLGETQLETTIRQLKEMGIEAEKLKGLQYMVDLEKATENLYKNNNKILLQFKEWGARLDADILVALGAEVELTEISHGLWVNKVQTINASILSEKQLQKQMSKIVDKTKELYEDDKKISKSDHTKIRSLNKQYDFLVKILKLVRGREGAKRLLVSLESQQSTALEQQTDQIDKQIIKTSALISLKKEMSEIEIPEIDATEWSYTYDQMIDDNRELVNALGYVGDTMSNVMVHGVDMMEAMEQTFKILIVQAIKYATIWAALSVLFPGSSALTGGGFGEFLIKGLFGSGLAGGTPDAPGGWNMVGEGGPEMMYVPQHSQVYTSSQTKNITSNLMNTSGIEHKLDQLIYAFQNIQPIPVKGKLRGMDFELMTDRINQNKMSD